MSDAAERAARVRRSAGWFERPDRGVIEVRGSDRVRWLHGMVSGNVAALSTDPSHSGCYALVLTAQGRIVADVHVLCLEDALWLEVAREALSDVMAHLDRYLIADDVTLADASDAWSHASLEGPRAPEILAHASGIAVAAAPDGWVGATLGGVAVRVGAWGWSGEAAYQLIAPCDDASAVSEAIAAAAASLGVELLRGDPETLEVLRIEAGVPRLGAELGPDVLPAEAGLIGRAVDLRKGCYTGQEIVARMEARDAAAHRLVGVALADARAGEEIAQGAEVSAGGKRIGEITSACRSAVAGAIGLGYVRRDSAAPGMRLRAGERDVRVVPLPFVAPAG